MGKAMSSAGGTISAVKDRSRKPTSDTHIQSLPSEILALIFARLSAEDCRSVRLVCKSWYEHSFERAVTKNQKFVFGEGNSFEEIAGFLLGSKIVSGTAQLNLEFHDLLMSNLAPTAWKECGHRVHTLHFQRCNFGYLTFARVIEHCVNLTTLIMEENEDYDGGDVNSLAVLTDLVDHGLVRSNLRTFAWFHKDCHLSTVVVQQIFFIFPGIKYFGTGLEPSYDYQLPPRVGEYDSSPYSNFDDCLNPSMQLERIVFNQPTDGSWMECSILKPEWSTRLIEFQMQVNFKNLPDCGRDLLFRFFAAQKNLEIITLNELNGDEVFAKQLMFYIFENCPKLCKLQIRFENEDTTGDRLILKQVAFQTYPEFAKFFSFVAKLKFFVVNFDVLLGFPSEMLSELPPTSFIMEELQLDQSIASETFCRTVLTRCSKLKYLKLGIFFDDILQQIFKNSDLRTLILCTYLYHGPHFSELTDYGFTGKSETRSGGFSIKHLQKLERLKIGIYDRFHINTAGWQKQDNGIFIRRSAITLDSIHELQLPRLKRLDLVLELESQLQVLESADPNGASPCEWYCLAEPIFKLPEQTIIHLVSSLPAVEKLIISPTPKDFETVFKVCEISKHLSFLQCARMDGFDVSRLFSVCPSLRNIELYEDGDEKREQFRFDPLTNKILCRTLHRRT